MNKIKTFTTILLAANFSLILSLFLSCQKENPQASNEIDRMLQQYDLPAGIQFALSAENTSDPFKAQDRDGIQAYPYSDGNCRVIFKVRNYDPTLPEGGNGEPCAKSTILFKGYSLPNGQGNLLFSESLTITGDWQVFTIPSSAYIKFIILHDQIAAPPCRFKFNIADYGWNRDLVTWYNISYDQWTPVLTGRFAPKDPTTDGTFNLYDEYLCDAWCTWTMPITFQNNDPFPDPWLNGASLFCFYGPNALPSGPFPGDCRVIKKHPLFDTYSKTLYAYPIATEAGHLYTTDARDTGTPDPYDIITYSVNGFTPPGAGPFVGWGVAPYNIITVGKNCTITHN